MKRSKLIFLIGIFLVIILTFVMLFSYKENISRKLSRTDSIIVTKLSSEDDFEEKQITDSNNIKKIIEIIDNREKISNNATIPYREIPHYKLKFMDNNDSIIYEINFFYYSADSSWISFSEDNSYYIIDSDSLLKILNF